MGPAAPFRRGAVRGPDQVVGSGGGHPHAADDAEIRRGQRARRAVVLATATAQPAGGPFRRGGVLRVPRTRALRRAVSRSAVFPVRRRRPHQTKLPEPRADPVLQVRAGRPHPEPVPEPNPVFQLRAVRAQSSAVPAPPAPRTERAVFQVQRTRTFREQLPEFFESVNNHIGVP